MILGILQHTPPWVWIVFTAIVLLGLQQAGPGTSALRALLSCRW
jgi:hypothetical protein